MLQIEPLRDDNVAHGCALAQELVSLGTFGNEVPFNWDYFFGFLLRSMDRPEFYIRLANVDGHYVGGVCGHLEPFLFAPVLMGIEDAWYVREGTPDRAKIAKQLMQGFVDWCYFRDAIMVQSGDVAGINTIGVDALYKRLGFERFGSIYRHKREA